MNAESTSIGLRIKQRRKERKVTQRDLCEAVKISENFLSQIENGKRLPSMETLGRIREYLDMRDSAISIPGDLRDDLAALIEKHSVQDIRRGLKELIAQSASG